MSLKSLKISSFLDLVKWGRTILTLDPILLRNFCINLSNSNFMKAFILVENIEHQIRTMKNEHSVNFCKRFFIGLSPGFENHICLNSDVYVCLVRLRNFVIPRRGSCNCPKLRSKLPSCGRIRLESTY